MYQIRFSEEARTHLRQFAAHERPVLLDRVEAVLTDQPTRPTRNLKVLRPNPISKYELRVNKMRVFFDVDEVAQRVLVLAIGRKEGNRLWIGGTEVVL